MWVIMAPPNLICQSEFSSPAAQAVGRASPIHLYTGTQQRKALQSMSDHFCLQSRPTSIHFNRPFHAGSFGELYLYTVLDSGVRIGVAVMPRVLLCIAVQQG